MSSIAADRVAAELESAVVVRVREDGCQVVRNGSIADARYAPQVPSPRVERISPGHRVALASAPDGWWVAGPAGSGDDTQVELEAVAALYTEHGLWPSALARP